MYLHTVICSWARVKKTKKIRRQCQGVNIVSFLAKLLLHANFRTLFSIKVCTRKRQSALQPFFKQYTHTTLSNTTLSHTIHSHNTITQHSHTQHSYTQHSYTQHSQTALSHNTLTQHSHTQHSHTQQSHTTLSHNTHTKTHSTLTHKTHTTITHLPTVLLSALLMNLENRQPLIMTVRTTIEKKHLPITKIRSTQNRYKAPYIQ